MTDFPHITIVPRDPNVPAVLLSPENAAKVVASLSGKMRDLTAEERKALDEYTYRDVTDADVLGTYADNEHRQRIEAELENQGLHVQLQDSATLVDAVLWAQSASVSMHCNYIGGEEAYTATYMDVANGGPDVCGHGASWVEAISALRTRLGMSDLCACGHARLYHIHGSCCAESSYGSLERCECPKSAAAITPVSPTVGGTDPDGARDAHSSPPDSPTATP